MQFTNTKTFDKVLTECLQLQAKLLEHFTDIPVISINTKSYKEVSETVIAQLKIVFDTYILSNAGVTAIDQRSDKEALDQHLNQINRSQTPHTQNLNSQQNLNQQLTHSNILEELSSVHSTSQNHQQFNYQNVIEVGSDGIKIIDKQSSNDILHQQFQKTSTSVQSLADLNKLNELNENTSNNLNLFLQTQELSAENDYLKKQVHSLKSQIEERIQEQKQMMEETQTKDLELRELIDMVRQYEDQIRELQQKLEEQIHIHEQRENAKIAIEKFEIQAHQEIQQVKLLFQEFILVKDEIEKNLEEIVKKVLDKDENITTLNNTNQEDQMSQNNGNNQLFTSLTTLQKFQEGFSSRKIQDIMRCEITEVKELLEVIKDLKDLINQMLQEKKQLKYQLQQELDLRGQIEKALENQELEILSPDLLIMKIKTLEHVLNGIQSIFDNPIGNFNQNELNGQANQQSTQYLIYQQLKLFSTEQLDEKVKLQERLRFVETQNQQLNEDLQTLLARVEECERENTEMRISGDKRIEEEKRKLLAEVEEIRQREEKLEVEIQQKLEEEIVRMQQELERELKEKFINSIAQVMKLNSSDKNQHMKDYDEALKYADLKFRTLQEKIDVLTENKELLMKERMIFEERMTEFSYENQMATKQVEQLHVQLQNTAQNYQNDISALKEEKDQLNQNLNMLMTKFRQTASELHEVREEREKLRKEIINLQEIIDSYERRNSYRNVSNHNPMQSSAILTTNQYSHLANSSNARPPISQSKNENSLSPSYKMQQQQLQYSEYSARGGSSNPTAVPQARKQPIQIYNSVVNSNSKKENIQNVADVITPSYQGSLVNSQFRSSLDEKQLTNLIKDYKSENMKFSQKVQELQKKIQNTAQLSPYKNEEKKYNQTQNQRAASSRPLNQRNNNSLMNSQNKNSGPGVNQGQNLNKLYFSTINTDEAPSVRFQRSENYQAINSNRSQNQRTLSCSIKKS